MTVNEVVVRSLPIHHLERTSFEEFGSLIAPETQDSPNLNRAPGNMGFLWVQKALEFPKQAYMCTLRYYHRGTRVEFLQKHPESTITLIPLGGRASVIVVSPEGSNGRPDIDHARAFLLDGTKGIVMHRGTWLRYAYPLGEFVDFAYITQRVDPATANSTDDTVRSNLETEFGFVLDLVFRVPEGSGTETGPSGALIAGPRRNPPNE